ncbi:ABC-type glycerol-3-phosphate transport system substrate-binding protein [Catenulispora sp. MAP5-51]|uniref:ABC transporter substrate-binding protein n=1 Tax=Catenulispora sp. MAP5-51 TaxID=3156298 RepID=UPI0035141C00
MSKHRQFHRRTAAAALATAMALTGLTACASGKSSESASTGSGQTLTYWSMWKQGEDQQKVLQASIDAFTAKTGIKVDVQWSGRQVLTQVMPRLSAGTVPDLVDGGGADLTGQLAPVDGALGLNDVYASSPSGETRKISDIVPASLVARTVTKDGQPLVVPYEILGVTNWFNELRDPDLVADPPKTWTDFVAVLDKLKAKGRTPISIEGDQADYEAYWYIYSLVRHGGVGLLDKAALDKTGAAFDDPAFLAAASDIDQLIKGGYIPADFTSTKYPVQQTGWADGTNKTDFLLMGTWAPSETGDALTKAGKDLASTIKYRSMPFPTVDGGKGNTAVEVNTIGFAIPKRAKNADAAKKFIEFFMAKDQIGGISSVAKNLTPRTDVAPPAELADFAKEYAAAGTTFLDKDGIGLDAPKWVSSVWQPLMLDFFNGKYDAAGFVAALKSKSVAYYQSIG